MPSLPYALTLPYQCRPLTSANPPLPPRLSHNFSPYLFQFSAAPAEPARLLRVEHRQQHLEVGSLKQQTFSPYARCTFSSTTFACVHLSSRKPLLAPVTRFALRSRHSARNPQQAFGGILSIPHSLELNHTGELSNNLCHRRTAHLSRPPAIEAD